MAETLTATSPLQGWSEKFAHLAPTVTLREEPFVAMVDLWADPDGSAASQASAILGLDLPTTPSTYASNDTLTVIWMGPQEWLITGGARSAAALEKSCALPWASTAAPRSTSPRSAPPCD